MTQDSTTHKKQAAATPATEDCSEAIMQAVEKQADEQVRCVRVFGDRYRCNWWVRDKGPAQPMFLTTAKIRRSRFLRVTKSADKLVIEDLSIRR